MKLFERCTQDSMALAFSASEQCSGTTLTIIGNAFAGMRAIDIQNLSIILIVLLQRDTALELHMKAILPPPEELCSKATYPCGHEGVGSW